VEHLTVAYRGFVANDDVSLAVADGSITALIGPNGAGKTSCFNAICGFVRPRHGRLTVHGQAVPFEDPRAVWAAGVGRTFQRLELFWTLSVRENIEVTARRAQRSLGRDAIDVDAVLERCGITDVATQIVADLPLGTCRLVELARALATGATVLLLDEPSSGLDRQETARFEGIVADVRRATGVSVLIVEHDMELVMALADHVYVLDFGRIIFDGSPAEVRASPIVQQVYLGGDAGSAARIPG